MASKVGSIKSTAGTINHFVQAVENNLLGTNEKLSESPTSFINILLDQIGSINAANFFEMLSIKEEAVKSTARLRRSLVRYLNSDEFVNILGTPASYSFNLGFKVSDLIEYSARVENSTDILYKSTIDKDSVVALIDRPTYTFDNDIDIYIRESVVGLSLEKKYNFFAKYNPVAGSVYGSVSNPFIKSFTQIVDGEKYFILNLLLNQYQRNYNEFNSLNSSSNKYELTVSYPNQLHAFEVMYKASETSPWEILRGEPDGVIIKDGYNFSLLDRVTGIHYLNIKFSRNPNYFSPVNGSSIKIVTYTTNGKSGNFILNGWNTNAPPIRGISFTQNIDDPYQYAITKMTPLITISSAESAGGKDEMSIDDLRNHVIRKSDSKSITLTELEEIAKEHGLRFSKERADILQIYYRLSGIIKSSSTIIDSTTGLVELDLGKLQYSQLTATRIMSPKTFINYANEKYYLINQDNISDISTYIANYNKLNLDISEREFFFPYFMRINLTEYVDCKVYDMYVNDIRAMTFEFFNESSTSEASIDFCTISRNPIDDEIYTSTIDNIDYPLIKGAYKVSCTIQVGDIIYDQIIDDDLVRIYIKLTGSEKSYIINNENVIITKIDDDNKLITLEAVLYTDCGVDTYDRITAIDNSVKSFPRQLNDDDVYLIDSTFDLSINISFKGTKRSSNSLYDSILTNEDIADGFGGMSAVYTLKEVSFLKNITDIIKPIIDVKVSRGERLRYEENVPDTYEQTIFETDINGEIVYENLTLPNGEVKVIPKILHKRYDIKYDTEGDIIYKYIIGDYKNDEDTGLPLYENDEEVVYIEARDFPLLDRIYAEQSSYKNTIDAFGMLVDKVKSFQKLCPTGTSGKLGVLNTIGSGNYAFINRKTNIQESIDRLALSFHIGIKPENSDIDNDILIETATSAIVTYIQNNSTSESMSFMEMLDDIKSQNFGVRYFELYKVNDYDEGVCHSIFSKSSTENNFDIITIKNKVSVTDGVMSFIPDIKITII